MPRSIIIQEALHLIAQRLDEYFQATDPSPDPWVVLSNLVDQDGSAYSHAQNKLVVYLANVQQDTTILSRGSPVGTGTSWLVQGYPAVYVNLIVVFFANFAGKNYPQGLGMVSQTIQFFQENPCFDPQNLPGLPSPIDKLAFEMVNLSPVDLNYYMSLAGVKYLPCVCYKARMIPFQSGAIQAQVPAARGFGAPADPKDLPEDLIPSSGAGGA